MRNSTVVTAGLAAVLFCGSIEAESKRPMTIVDLINVPSISDPRLSPDGTQLLYTLSEADWGKNKRTAHIWRTDTDGSNVIRMTNGENGESSPRWAPDGLRFSFITQRGDCLLYTSPSPRD